MLKKIKDFVWKIVIAVQKVLLTILLFFLYYIGFGLTFLFAILFRRSILRRPADAPKSRWFIPSGYDPVLGDSGRES